VRRLKHRVAWQSERGFTLAEVMIVVVLMGVVLAIAASSWFGMIESRRVDSSSNQMVSELRLAHTRATNRLTNWRVEFDPNTGNYRTGSCVNPCTATLTTPTRSLEEGTEFPPGLGVVAVVFKADGTAQIIGTGNVQVAAADGSPCRQIEVNTVTSRVRVSTSVC
jgi:prepilin-type N-terminal cleavage/methylation domain-containing protein